jgi:hypothetical protein
MEKLRRFPAHLTCVDSMFFIIYFATLSAANIFIPNKYYGLSFPKILMFVNPRDKYFVTYFLHFDSNIPFLYLK